LHDTCDTWLESSPPQYCPEVTQPDTEQPAQVVKQASRQQRSTREQCKITRMFFTQLAASTSFLASNSNTRPEITRSSNFVLSLLFLSNICAPKENNQPAAQQQRRFTQDTETDVSYAVERQAGNGVRLYTHVPLSFACNTDEGQLENEINTASTTHFRSSREMQCEHSAQSNVC
jgi:hypothetical protein